MNLTPAQKAVIKKMQEGAELDCEYHEFTWEPLYFTLAGKKIGKVMPQKLIAMELINGNLELTDKGRQIKI